MEPATPKSSSSSARDHPELQCHAKSKRSGERCGRYAVPGARVCATHGGNAVQVREAGARRLHTRTVEASATAVLASYGIEAIEDPLDELGKLTAESRAMLDALGARVNNLEDLATYDEKRAPHLRVEIEMYERAMDRTHRLLDSLVKHGYTERQVKLAESEALLVAGVIRRVISSLGLEPAQEQKAQHLLAEEFRALDALL